MTHRFVREKLTRNIDTLYAKPVNKKIYIMSEIIRWYINLSITLAIILLCLSLFGSFERKPETPKIAKEIHSQVSQVTKTQVMPTIVAQKKISVQPVKIRQPEKKASNTPKNVLSEVIEADKTSDFNVYALANAVAMAETQGCKVGYGVTHNNCHGIKSGNTAPCPGTPLGKMCKFKTQKESYEAFVKIWTTWYKTYPTLQQAKTWTGDDKKTTWLAAVDQHYKAYNK